MDLLIVGAGRMGRWFGHTVREGADRRVSLSFLDADPAVATAAADHLDGDAISTDAEDRFDVVCLAVPVPALETAARAHAGRARRAVCDVAGVMGPAVEALASNAPDCQRVSFHPLFAPENAPGTVAAVPDRPGETTDAIGGWLEAAGNRLFETTPEAHDIAMETVQAKAHAAVLAFALAADDVDPAFSTPVFEALADLVGTVTGNDPRVYADVQETYSGAGEVADAAREIAEADHDRFQELYREAERFREPYRDDGIDGGDSHAG